MPRVVAGDVAGRPLALALALAPGVQGDAEPLPPLSPPPPRDTTPRRLPVARNASTAAAALASMGVVAGTKPCGDDLPSPRPPRLPPPRACGPVGEVGEWRRGTSAPVYGRSAPPVPGRAPVTGDSSGADTASESGEYTMAGGNAVVVRDLSEYAGRPFRVYASRAASNQASPALRCRVSDALVAGRAPPPPPSPPPSSAGGGDGARTAATSRIASPMLYAGSERLCASVTAPPYSPGPGTAARALNPAASTSRRGASPTAAGSRPTTPRATLAS